MLARSPEQIRAPIAAASNSGDFDAFIELHEPGSGDGRPARDDLQVSGRRTRVSRRQPDGSRRIVLDNPMSPP